MLIKSFKYAVKGIVLAFKTERNFKIMCCIFIFVLITGAFLQISHQDWISIIIISGFVLVSELFNSTIENLVDLVMPEYHKLAEKIKDFAAGAVLIGAIFSIIVGLLVFLPYFR